MDLLSLREATHRPMHVLTPLLQHGDCSVRHEAPVSIATLRLAWLATRTSMSGSRWRSARWSPATAWMTSFCNHDCNNLELTCKVPPMFLPVISLQIACTLQVDRTTTHEKLHPCVESDVWCAFSRACLSFCRWSLRASWPKFHPKTTGQGV